MKPLISPRLETAEPLVKPDGDTAVIDEAVENTDDGDQNKDGYRVLIYNDDHTPIDLVVKQIVKATACSTLKATKITLEAHHKGRAVCYRGSKGKCQQVARVLREIRLQCEVDCD